MSRSAQRVIGICGIAFFLLQLPIVLLPIPPGPDTTVADAATYWAAHRDAFLFLNYLGALGVAPALVFIAGLNQVFKRAEGEDGWLHQVYFASAIAAAALGLALFWVFQVQATVKPASGQDTLQLALVMTNLLWAFALLATVPAVVAAGVIVIRSGVLPAALGYLSLLVAAVLLVASFGAFVSTGWLASGSIFSLAAFGLDGVWFLVIALVLVIRPRELPRIH